MTWRNTLLRSGRGLARLLWPALALTAVLGAPARADVWGFVDARGVPRFASEKLDERYELFFRGAAAPGAAAPEPAAPTPRPVAVPTAPPRLLAFFEVSPSYKQVRHLMRDAAEEHRLDYELLQALIATESGFDIQAVSPRGAVGLMQVMPATAERWGVTGDRKTSVARKLADPMVNLRTGSRYLRHLLDRFPGQLELALAAYNAGEGAVARAGNRIPGYRETQDYVRTVMQLYQILKPPVSMTAARGAQRGRPDAAPQPAVAGVAPLRGGAIGRGNMPGSVGAVGPLVAVTDVDIRIERD